MYRIGILTPVALLAVMYPVSALAQSDAIVLAELGEVELLSRPQPSPGPGFLATIVTARTLDPADRIVTFENIKITNTHHVWVGNGLQSQVGNAQGAPRVGPLFHESWLPFDSHLLIAPNMLGGCAGCRYSELFDTNDGSTNLSLPPVLNDIPAMTGFGVISMVVSHDAFFVAPEFQRNTIDLAYLVTTDDGAPMELTIGLLGEGFVHSGLPGGASFGFHGNPPVHVVIPEPSGLSLFAVFCLALIVGPLRSPLIRGYSYVGRQQGCSAAGTAQTHLGLNAHCNFPSGQICDRSSGD